MCDENQRLQNINYNFIRVRRGRGSSNMVLKRKKNMKRSHIFMKIRKDGAIKKFI